MSAPGFSKDAYAVLAQWVMSGSCMINEYNGGAVMSWQEMELQSDDLWTVPFACVESDTGTS